MTYMDDASLTKLFLSLTILFMSLLLPACEQDALKIEDYRERFTGAWDFHTIRIVWEMSSDYMEEDTVDYTGWIEKGIQAKQVSIHYLADDTLVCTVDAAGVFTSFDAFSARKSKAWFPADDSLTMHLTTDALGAGTRLEITGVKR